MQHYFDKDIAVEYGIIEAILLNYIQIWIEKNKANNVNYYNGSYWTYNSIKAFNTLFPYCSERQIQNALKHLKEEDLIKTGNYNTSTYDRTLWYAFTEKGISIMQKCKMETAKMLNGNGKNVEPIPYIKEEINNNKLLFIPKKETKKFIKPTLEEVKEYCLERKNNIDAETFIDFYESKGWYVGKNKMKDWKATIRTWERNRKNQNNFNPATDYDISRIDESKFIHKVGD